jgi:hypothetical protein
VAAIVIVELLSLLYALVAAPGFFTDLQLLVSDVIFLGLSILLSQIYKVRTIFSDEEHLLRVQQELGAGTQSQTKHTKKAVTIKPRKRVQNARKRVQKTTTKGSAAKSVKAKEVAF